ncbi:MAG: hypothetical protein JHC61_05080 [Burkholderiaceae bacterium]|nr:hypothetical protein [Burkholderiaceae bacterium]
MKITADPRGYKIGTIIAYWIAHHESPVEEEKAMKGILLWLIGIPIPIIILLWLFGVF